MIALIDSDILVYRVGFTTQDVNEAIACWRMDESIIGILKAVNTTLYKSFLTSQEKNNYRYEIYPEYKATRTASKPTHYQILRDHLILAHNSIVTENQEADDQLGIEQTDDTIICTIDKDLDQIPGWHYNFVRGIKYQVTPEEGLHTFYMQLLQGDRIDNIPGIVGVGPKKAEKILAKSLNEREMYERCLHEYVKHFGEGDAFGILVRNGRLLRIRTKPNEELWNPPQ